MKVLLIGGTGTISSCVTERLAAREDISLCLFNRRGGRSEGNITYIKGDINDAEQAAAALAGMEFDVACNFIIYTEQQAQANIELFTGIAKQFIHISSVTVNDRRMHCVFDEQSPVGNIYSDYARKKQQTERCFMDAYERDGFPVTIVRPSHTYSGDRIPLSVKGSNSWSVADRMLRGKPVIVHGDGQSIWSSTHAADFAAAFEGLVGNPATVGEVYQIMNEQPHTWDMLYHTLANLLGVEYKPVYIPTGWLARSSKYDFLTALQGDKQYSCIFDTSKIKAIVPDIKWEIDYAAGLRMYLEYMDAHPELKQPDAEFDAWSDATIEKYQALEREFVQNV